MSLNDDHQHRVAKNPKPCEPIRPLIFHELESQSCRSHKVMISATALTVNFPVCAAGGPTIAFKKKIFEKMLLSRLGQFGREATERKNFFRCLGKDEEGLLDLLRLFV